MLPRLLFLFVCVVAIVSFLEESFRYENEHPFLRLNSENLKHLFPFKKYRSYRIINTVCNQSIYPHNILSKVQNVKSKRYELWHILSFGLNNQSEPIYHSENDFQWVVSSDCSDIIIADERVLTIYSYTEHLERRNSRKFRGVITALARHGNDLMVETTMGMYKVYIMYHQRKGLGVWMHKLVLSAKFKHATLSLSNLNSNYFVLCNPNYRQMDGNVSVYKLGNKQNDNKISPRLDVLSYKAPASCFGHSAVLTDSCLIVSAPFAPTPEYGRGCVIVYRLVGAVYTQHQVITVTDKHVNHFGIAISVSKSTKWLAIAGKIKGKGGRAFVFEFNPETHLYTKIREVDCPNTTNISVDESGDMVISCESHVFLSMR